MTNVARRTWMTALTAAMVLLVGIGASVAQDKPITTDDAWVKLPEAGAKTTSAYVTVNNPGMYAIYLGFGSSDAAGKIEFRDVSKGNAPQDDVTVPAYDSAYLNPKGIQIYLSDLKKDLKEGDSVHITLKTELGIPIEIDAKVKKE
jgi:copper(I)-binding protein